MAETKLTQFVLLLACVVHGFSSKMADLQDINLGVLLPISQYSTDHLCSNEISGTFMVENAEAVAYAISKVNSHSDLLPNVTLGYVILDTCGGKETPAIARAMQFLPINTDFGVCEKAEAPMICEVDNATREHFNILGVIAPPFSSTSMAISPILTAYNIPHISALASNDDLSNKVKYPYFLRVIPADAYIAQAMVSIVHHFNWTYVSLIYRGDVFGQNGANHIKDMLKDKDICLAELIQIDLTFSTKDYDIIVKTLLKVKTAKVVIAYITSDEGRPLRQAVERHAESSYLIWVTTGSGSVMETDMITVLSTTTQSTPSWDLMTSYSYLTPYNNQKNPWFYKAWEMYHSCKWNIDKSTDSSTRNCRDYEQLTLGFHHGPKPISSTYIDVVNIFAHALHSLIITQCPDVLSSEFKDDLIQNCVYGERLLTYLYNVSFEGMSGHIKFNDAGDIMAQILIRAPVGEKNITKYDNVGVWNMESDLIRIDREIIFLRGGGVTAGTVPNSDCSQPCKRGQRYVGHDVTCCWECVSCLANEIHDSNQTICSPCPLFHWPDQITFTECHLLETNYLNLPDPLAITIISLALLGLILASTVTFFFIKNKNKKLIKASSWKMSIIMLTGIFLQFITSIFTLIKPMFLSCLVLRMGYGFSFTFVYAPLLIKTITVYRIFSNKTKTFLLFIGLKWQYIFVGILLVMQVSTIR